MPLYEVQHYIPLSLEERNKFAKEITRIHTREFITPSLFVNVQFTELKEGSSFIAGEEKKTNRVIAFLRGGPRTREQFVDVTKQVKKAWDEIMNEGKAVWGERQLSLVGVIDGLAGGLEHDFVAPEAGKDVAWLKNHKSDFQKLASEGNDLFVGILQEMENREDLVAKLQQD
ncbi:putative oxalocrotonate tautomerase enzyme domain-containing protein [Trichoderma breve]|uniref:Oxalocrotonate tautomerase enzyme domain-containing protein n=1 Tax=Trichoderma breve TaxID=2034170 RepID=A0A9W9E926_9HYPO|nr:putative oxalocrotonate tautomerase enzyme domain-containing protein [Trichoderma breve]KAJ4861157.1 putative oxalocrotonate tautomerase enzyme domain-containing protein [Trichoderma breve]